MQPITQYRLWPDIEPIMMAGSPQEYEYKAVLHSRNSELEILQIITMDIVSDYISNYTDVIFMRVNLPMGDFIHTILPFKDLLEMELTIGQYSTRYRVILPSDILQYSEDMYKNLTADDINKESEELITLQLVSLAAEPARMAPVRGVFQGTMDEIIPNIFKSMDITIDGNSIASKVNMLPADNKKRYNNIVIDTNTPILDVCNLLQATHGVYYRGIGRYLTQSRGLSTWMIYDLYNPLRHNKVDDRAAIRCFLIPAGMTIAHESTWTLENGVFSFYATTALEESKSIDPRPTNRALGFTYNDSAKLSGGDVLVKEGVPYGSTDQVAKRAMLIQRKDDYVDLNRVGTISSKYAATSEVMSNFLDVISIVWHTSMPYHILPGDTLNLYKVDQLGMTIEYPCIILKQHTTLVKSGKGTSNTPLTPTTILTIGLIDR